MKISQKSENIFYVEYENNSVERTCKDFEIFHNSLL